MSAAPGRSYGPYEIIAPLGEGGMGEVFKARDTRLGRTVALKVSRDRFADRFANEARAVAALNHPHIATLYDVGPDYLVMEYVEGETLQVPQPAPRALLYARQILEALEAAHRKGIVHRDLKPANIMVTKAGIKLLDFGLAHINPAAGMPVEATATLAQSLQGGISGTLHYMSPEQLEGKPADPRSDIFAFGLVLYELLSGRRAFEADSAAGIISAIMAAEPRPLHELQPVLPVSLERIVQRCLSKDPDERWQTAFDIRCALDLAELPADALPPPAPAANRVLPWALGALAVGALAVGGIWWLSKSAAAPTEPWTFRPLTYSGRSYLPALSPDGKQMAYLWTKEKDSDMGIYVQLVNGGNPLKLSPMLSGSKPAWSPDGAQIAAVRSDGVYVMPALGGPVRRAVTFKGAENDLAWSPDGKYFIVGGEGDRTGLWALPVDGGEPRRLTTPERAVDRFPVVSPAGDSLAFVRRTSTYNTALMVLALNADGSAKGSPRSVTSKAWDIGSLDWQADGKHIVFAASGGSSNPNLWRISTDGGEPVRLPVPTMVADHPSISRTSSRLVYVSPDTESAVFKMPLNASSTKALPQSVVDTLGVHRDLAVSPDGLHFAFVSNRTGSKEIWIANADGSGQTQITFFGGPALGSPQWSPDSQQIAFDGYAAGSSDIYTVSIDGGKPKQLTTDSANEIRPFWSSDGKSIYFGWDRGGQGQIWKMPSSGGSPVQITREGGTSAFETHDGQWLYVVLGPRLLRMRPDGKEVTQAYDNARPNFVALGNKHVYVFNPNNAQLLRAPLGTDRFELVHQFDEATKPFGGGNCIGVPGDESYLLYRRETRMQTTLVLLEGFR